MQRELSIQGNMIWNSVGSLVSLVCQWLTTVLVVRLSNNYDAAGVLSLAMAISNVFAPIAQYKIRSYQVSDVKKETSAGEYVTFRLITIPCALVISVVYALATTDHSAFIAIALYLLYRSSDIFADVLYGIEQQHLRMDYCGKSMAMRGVVSLASFCAGLILFDSLEIAILAMFLTALPFTLYDWKMAASLDVIHLGISGKKVLQLLTSCLPAVIGTACCTAVVTVARQCLNDVAGTDALGIYATVCTPVVVIQAGANHIYAPLLGVFAGALAREDYAKYRKLFAKVSLVFVLLTLVGEVGFFLVGTPFLQIIFGSTAAENAYLMYAAIPSVILCAFITFLSDQLIAMRIMWGVLVGNGIALLLTLFFASPLIQSFGSNGTSIIVIISYAIGCAMMLALLFAKTGTARATERA